MLLNPISDVNLYFLAWKRRGETQELLKLGVMSGYQSIQVEFEQLTY